MPQPDRLHMEVVHWWEQQPKPPRLNELEGWSTGYLFFRFLKFWSAEFNYNQVVSLRCPGMTKTSKQWYRRAARHSIALEDPMETDRDLGAQMSNSALTATRCQLVSACISLHRSPHCMRQLFEPWDWRCSGPGSKDEDRGWCGDGDGHSDREEEREGVVSEGGLEQEIGHGIGSGSMTTDSKPIEVTLVGEESGRSAEREVAGAAMVAVDCEMQSDTGSITLVQVFTGLTTLIFDLLTQDGMNAFCGLRPHLEDPRKPKVFHDCRQDRRLLLQQLNIKVEGIFDTQAAHLALNSSNKKSIGLNQVLQHWLPASSHNQFKSEVGLMMGRDPSLWAHRPLTPKLLQYAAQDVCHLLQLKSVLSDQLEQQNMTSQYQDMLRRYLEFSHVQLPTLSLINLQRRRGQQMDAFISNITDLGVFCWLGERVQGLVHYTEKPPCCGQLTIGDPVVVRLVAVDLTRAYISLSLNLTKELLNPDVCSCQELVPGQLLQGFVRKFRQYGVQVGLDLELHGLLHSTQSMTVAQELKTLKSGELVQVEVLCVTSVGVHLQICDSTTTAKRRRLQ